ncbi:MAG: hypothetical protein HZB44_08540 [Actinobacteria bacterium]|nr:hypothetical protein [Actinomycetota bacterium]
MNEETKKLMKQSLPYRVLYDDLPSKDHETEVLQQFLSRLQIRYRNIEKRECPDFFIHCEDTSAKIVIGCEITDYYWDGKAGSTEAQFLHQWKALAKSLRHGLDERGGKERFIYGAVHFRHPTWDVLKRIDCDQLIQEIIGLVARQPIFARLTIDNFTASEPNLQQHVDHIYLKDTDGEEGVLWWPAHLQSGEIRSCEERLEEIIHSKNQKALNYDWSDSDEQWLLIYAGAKSLADTVISVKDGFEDDIKTSGFTRIYLWDKFMESISEIYPNKIGIWSATTKNLYRRNYPPAVRRFVV